MGRDKRQILPVEDVGAIRVPAFGGCAYMIRRWVSFLMCVMIHPFFPFRFLPPVFAQHSPRTPGRNHRPASLFCFCQCPGARFRRPSHMSGADAPRPVSPRGSALVSPFKRRASACARPFSSICNACPGLCLQRHPLPPGGWFPAGVAVALSARGALRVVIRNFSLGPYRAFGANGHQKAPSRYGLTFPCGPFSLRDPPVMDNGVRVAVKEARRGRPRKQRGAVPVYDVPAEPWRPWRMRIMGQRGGRKREPAFPTPSQSRPPAA